MNNQYVYATYGIQPDKTGLIAAKLGVASPYSEDAVRSIVGIATAAKDSGMPLKAYLESIEFDRPQASSVGVPPMDDQGAAAEMQAGVQASAMAIVDGGNELFAGVESYCKSIETDLSSAVVDRMNQVPARTAKKIAEGLKRANPKFFQFAPTGAELPTFDFADRGFPAFNASPDRGLIRPAIENVQVGQDDQAI